jgi:hypothetical protein
MYARRLPNPGGSLTHEAGRKHLLAPIFKTGALRCTNTRGKLMPFNVRG